MSTRSAVLSILDRSWQANEVKWSHVIFLLMNERRRKENWTYARKNLLLIEWVSTETFVLRSSDGLFDSILIRLCSEFETNAAAGTGWRWNKKKCLSRTRLLIRHWIISYITLACRSLAIVAEKKRARRGRRAEKTMKRQGQSWRSANLVQWTNEKFPPLNAWRENFNDICVDVEMCAIVGPAAREGKN